MLSFEHTEQFDYPATAVFALLADLDARPSWLDGIVEQRVTPEGPARLGTTYFESGKYGGYKSEKTSTVTEFEQDRLLTLKTLPDSPQEYRESFRVQPISENSCNVQFITQIGGVPKVAEIFMRQTMKKGQPQSAQRLKSVLANRA